MSTESLIIVSLVREEVNKYAVKTNEEARNIVQQLFSICDNENDVGRICREWLNKENYQLSTTHFAYDKK